MSYRHLIATVWLALVTSTARADLITLDPNSIMPGKGGQSNPTVVVGNASISYALDAKNQPILPSGSATAANDGYQIVNFTYTVTAKANPGTGMADRIQVDWLTQEGFSLSKDSNITVAITGNMSISLTGGGTAGAVGGLIDSNVNPTALFKYPPPPQNANVITGPANNVQVPWNTSGVKMDVGAGNNHTLNMVMSFAWNPAAVGDTLTITGSYTVTASAVATGVPEPSSFVLGAIGAIGACFFGAVRSRKGVPPRCQLVSDSSL